MKRVIVIGGGASGLMAAIAAAGQGARVVLAEKNRLPGKKLLATGNGRCNFSNRDQRLSHYRSGRPELVKAVLEAFSMEDTVSFFEELGILVKDRAGYLYPASGQASSVAEVLRLEVRRLSGQRLIKEAYNTEVLSVKKEGGVFRVETGLTKGKRSCWPAVPRRPRRPALPETGTGSRRASDTGLFRRSRR